MVIALLLAGGWRGGFDDVRSVTIQRPGGQSAPITAELAAVSRRSERRSAVGSPTGATDGFAEGIQPSDAVVRVAAERLFERTAVDVGRALDLLASQARALQRISSPDSIHAISSKLRAVLADGSPPSDRPSASAAAGGFDWDRAMITDVTRGDGERFVVTFADPTGRSERVEMTPDVLPELPRLDAAFGIIRSNPLVRLVHREAVVPLIQAAVFDRLANE